MALPDDDLTYAVIGCSRWIYNEFGGGLLESAYVGSLVHACRKRGLSVQREVSAPFWFDGAIVANYRLDLVVENRLIVEVKAVAALLPEHVAQTLHYVRATDFELALLLNFGRRPEVRRFTIRNALKKRDRQERVVGTGEKKHEETRSF
jgi:GxxExxY protein